MENNNDVIGVAVNRNKVIIQTGIVGIIANIFLASFKAAVGFFTNSIAITLDAVNNLTDALSSIITIVGTILSGKLPTKKFPMGYGRVEYLSSMIVSAIVIYAGITAVVESIKKIIHPEVAEYTPVSLIIISVAIVVKIILGLFTKRRGESVGALALVAAGTDAFFDALLSASVLASAIIYMFTGVSLEAYVGVVIGIIIVKSGLELLTETVDDILGHRADKELSSEIKRIINTGDRVRGCYDLFIHNYGPNKNYASCHVELPDTMTVDEVDVLTRDLQLKVYKATGVVLVGVGVYSFNTSHDEVAGMRESVRDIVLAHEGALQVHGFYVDLEKKIMRFDVVFSFDCDPQELTKIIVSEITDVYPQYEVYISPDIDLSD